MRNYYSKLIISFFLGILLCWTLNSYAYTVPVGIPDPTIYFDGFDPINTSAPVVNEDGTCSKCPNWPSSENRGCYFIDNTDPNATDTNNSYGYPDKPRKTIPEIAYSAGDFIYINGGTYSSKGDRFNWGGVGTASSPIWFCGNPSNRPKLPRYVHFYINTNYFIMDSIEFPSNGRIDIRPTSENITIKHLVIRNCSFEGTKSSSDGGAITVGQSTGSPYSGSFISDIVIYNNHMRNYGDVNTTEQCGVYMGFPMERLWVLKNEIHHFGADGVAGCHNADRDQRYSMYYFIGDNKIYDNGENAIDLKAIQHYVISQNEMAGPHYREGGASIVLHYGANSLGCTHGWVIFNKIHNSGAGVAITDVDAETYVIGNLIYNLFDPSSIDTIDGSGVGFRGMDGKLVIAGNTIYGYTRHGIVCDQEVLNPEDTVIIENNILANRSGSGHEIQIDANVDRVTIRNNLYYYPQGTASINWNGPIKTLSEMKSLGQCEGGLEGDPKFVNPSSGDFSLEPNSPAIDNGVESSAYGSFQAEYSLSIKKDFLGITRPQGEGWDIGAFEFVEGGGSNGSSPPTPTNLRIQ